MKKIGAQRTELWPTVCYKKLCVDRELNCGQKYVTWSRV